jgi:hypothetical protein
LMISKPIGFEETASSVDNVKYSFNISNHDFPILITGWYIIRTNKHYAFAIEIII